MNRSNILRISATPLGIALMTSATVGQPAKSDKERFVGTWTLVSLTSPDGAAALRRVLSRLKKDEQVWLTDTDAILKAASLK